MIGWGLAMTDMIGCRFLTHGKNRNGWYGDTPSTLSTANCPRLYARRSYGCDRSRWLVWLKNTQILRSQTTQYIQSCDMTSPSWLRLLHGTKIDFLSYVSTLQCCELRARCCIFCFSTFRAQRQYCKKYKTPTQDDSLTSVLLQCMHYTCKPVSYQGTPCSQVLMQYCNSNCTVKGGAGARESCRRV